MINNITIKNSLAANARLWIYLSSKSFDIEEVTLINRKSEQFLQSWTAHGSKLHAAIELIERQFIMVFVDEKAAKASGCSIDKLTKFVQTLGKELEVDLFNRWHQAYFDNNSIKTFDYRNLQELIKSQAIHEDTIICNNLINSKQQLENEWLIPIKHSWMWPKD